MKYDSDVRRMAEIAAELDAERARAAALDDGDATTTRDARERIAILAAS